MVIKNRYLKEYLKHLGRSVIFWTLAIMLFAIFRFFGIEDEVGLTIKPEFTRVYKIQQILPSYALGGFLIGILYATVEFYFDKYAPKRLPIGLNIFVQALLMFISVIVISDIGIRIFSKVYDLTIEIRTGWWYRDRSFWSMLFYIPFASFFFSVIVTLADKFGNSAFIKILIGYYRNPKEENRVFMFLDLKDSTTIAEKIGHIKYSQLIQDCFYDLNEIVLKYDAEIYQYIGDEVVLSWSYSEGKLDHSCIRLFFAFQEKLDRKSNYYMRKFGTTPVFKAGLHGGMITATEVGVIKKELAYHGDVVNTTARIQGECNKYQELILISEKLLSSMNITDLFLPRFVGKVLLKGKKNQIEIFALEPFTASASTIAPSI